MMTHGSLFTGIGGFDLAAEWAGIENIFQVEIDKFCQKVLSKNFPKTKKYYDIKEFDGTEYKGKIDIISGGFPCQPFSITGKRKGTNDDRYLFPEMLRVISEIKPDWVIAENVYGFINIQNGLVFEQACLALENLNYEVQSFVIPAAGLNAPHKRDRLWLIAKNVTDTKSIYAQGRKDGQRQNEFRRSDKRTTLDTYKERLQRSNIKQIPERENIYNGEVCEIRGNSCKSDRRQYWNEDWIKIATEFCRVDDGLPVELDGFKLTRPQNRTERLKSLGNAIVPQIAYEIFKSIIQTNEQNK